MVRKNIAHNTKKNNDHSKKEEDKNNNPERLGANPRVERERSSPCETRDKPRVDSPRSEKESAAASDKIEELVESLKSKKGLTTLDDDFVRDKVDRIFASNNIIKRKFQSSASFKQFSKSQEHEELQKRIRKELRAIYGVFQTDEGKARREIIDKLRITHDDTERKKAVDGLLETHTSTKERLPHYDEIYAVLCEKIHPTSIVDLGCGMNPLAHHYFAQHNCWPTIVASDISADDMKFLDECFAALSIPGKTIPLDLTKDSDIAKLPALTKGADATLLFKLLDSLEEAKRHISYKLFDSIKSRWIVASFPTKSLGGKKNIARAGRSWFERLLARKGLAWETFSVENELFYVVKR